MTHVQEGYSSQSVCQYTADLKGRCITTVQVHLQATPINLAYTLSKVLPHVQFELVILSHVQYAEGLPLPECFHCHCNGIPVIA